MAEDSKQHGGAAGEVPPLDIAEKGRRGGEVISLDRRLFMKFTAFGDCEEPEEAIAAIAQSGIDAAVYLDAHDPQGIGVMAASEDPDFLVTTLRDVFGKIGRAACRASVELDGPVSA